MLKTFLLTSVCLYPIVSSAQPHTLNKQNVITALGYTPISNTAVKRSIRDWNPICDGAADDSTVLATAATAMRDTGGTIYVPANCRLRLGGAAQVWLRGVTIEADGSRDTGGPTGAPGSGVYGLMGGTILLTDIAAPPFVVSSGWGLKGLKFYWPAQQPMVTPIVFPPLVAVHGSDVAYGGTFSDNQVINAYDIVDLTAGGSGTGHTHIERNMLFALRRSFQFRSLGGESWITDNQFSSVAFYYVAGGNSCMTGPGNAVPCMYEYATANSEAVRIVGDGTSSAVSTVSVDGLRMSGNYFFFQRYGIRIVGGSLNLANLANNGFDQVMTVLQAESGGGVRETTITGGTWLVQRAYHGETPAPAVSITGSIGNSLYLSGVDMSVVAGGGIVFADPSSGGFGADPKLSIVGGNMSNIGNISGTGYRAVDFNSPYGTLTISGTTLDTKAAGNVTEGVLVTAARAFSITGNSFNGWNSAVNIGSGALGAYVGNTITNTRSGSGATAIGAGLTTTVQAGNKSDLETSSASLVPSIAAGQPALNFTGTGTNVGGMLKVKGAAGIVIGGDNGTYGLLYPSGAAAQTSYFTIQSGVGGVAYSASAGNVTVRPGSGGILDLANLPTCSAATTGQLCSGTGASSTVGIK